MVGEKTLIAQRTTRNDYYRIYQKINFNGFNDALLCCYLNDSSVHINRSIVSDTKVYRVAMHWHSLCKIRFDSIYSVRALIRTPQNGTLEKCNILLMFFVPIYGIYAMHRCNVKRSLPSSIDLLQCFLFAVFECCVLCLFDDHSQIIH